MATNKPRFPITIEPEIAEIIENYRHQHKISSTSKATVELLVRGIEEFHKQEAGHEEMQRNKAPTAESAAEALYEVLYYFLGHPPTPGEIRAFQSVIPVICNGVNGSE